MSAQLKLSLRLTDGGDGQQHSLTLSDPGPDCWTEDKLIFTSLADCGPGPGGWLRQIITFVSCGHKNVEIPTPRDTLNTNWVWPLVCTAISLAGDGIQGSEYQSGFVNNNDYH